MYLLFDEPYPLRDDLQLFSTSNTPLFVEIDEWFEWIDAQGEVIFKMVCEDGIVVLVRIQ